MRDKHIFSKSYEARKEAVLNALRREEATEESKNTRYAAHTVLKIAAFAAVLSALSVGVYAAVQLIDFSVEQNGDEIRIHASLNESGESTADKEEKPLRSWRPEEGEVSIRLNIPDLPSDMEEDKTANGKYHSEDSSRSMTVNGIDLRRSDLNQIIGGAASVKQFDVGGKPMYIIAGGEADYYRIAYILFEEEDLVLKLWVGYGITDDELLTMVSTLTLEKTDDALLAIPIQNEVSSSSDIDIPFVYVSEDDSIYEADLLEIGESKRDDNDWYTATVNRVDVYDSINMLNPNYILRKNFVERFTDTSGNLIPYNRTEIIYTAEDGKYVSRHFGENITSQKKLYVVTLTMADISMDDIAEEDRDGMLKACVHGFHLDSYTVADGKIDMVSSNAVVDKKPDAHADSSEPIYREYLGNNQWKVAYLVDETIADDNLVLNTYTGKIFVKIQ